MATQGDGMRVTLDLTRYNDTEIDISGHFNGRVGDTQDLLPLRITDNDYSVDLRNYGVVYGGTDHNMVPHRHIIKKVGDLQTYRGDAPVKGKFTLPFDDRTFNVPGHWNQFFIRFINEKGDTISSVDLDFDVFDDTFMAHIGDAEDIYVEEFEKILQQVTDAGDKTKKDIEDTGDKFKTDFDTWIAKYKQALNDAMAEVNDPKNGLYIRYSQLLDMTKQIQETLKQAQFHDRPFQLKTVADMKSYTPLIAGDIVITQGWDNYDDGHGAYWNIRVKHKDETPDEQNVISINTDMGLVAERNSSLLSADSLEDFLYGYTIEIKHNQCEHPLRPAVLYYEDAIGTERDGLGKTSHGFGQTNTKLINCIAEYPDANTIKVKIPRNFYLDTVPHYKFGAWYLIDGNRTIKVDLGMPIDDAKAQAGDGEGNSYLSPNTGYFSKPTSPSDLRAVYIDEHTQRLLWRD